MLETIFEELKEKTGNSIIMGVDIDTFHSPVYKARTRVVRQKNWISFSTNRKWDIYKTYC